MVAVVVATAAVVEEATVRTVEEEEGGRRSNRSNSGRGRGGRNDSANRSSSPQGQGGERVSINGGRGRSFKRGGRGRGGSYKKGGRNSDPKNDASTSNTNNRAEEEVCNTTTMQIKIEGEFKEKGEIPLDSNQSMNVINNKESNTTENNKIGKKGKKKNNSNAKEDDKSINRTTKKDNTDGNDSANRSSSSQGGGRRNINGGRGRSSKRGGGGRGRGSSDREGGRNSDRNNNENTSNTKNQVTQMEAEVTNATKGECKEKNDMSLDSNKNMTVINNNDGNTITDSNKTGKKGKKEKKENKNNTKEDDKSLEKTSKKDNAEMNNNKNTKLNTIKNNKKKQKEKSMTKNNEDNNPDITIPPSQPQTTNDLNYGRNQTVSILHVAEKPSIAQAIAKGLCPDPSLSNSKTSLPVYEFIHPFSKCPHASKVYHKVTSVAGHVYSIDFPSQYQSWDKVDPAMLFHVPTVRKATKGSTVFHLQDQSKNVDFIILWMDCDREGENINFEVLDNTLSNMKYSETGMERVYRAHFSAINPSDIQKAYEFHLGKPDKQASESVEARQELDLKVGVAFSRFQTKYFQGRYGDLDSAVLSYGPCQTPTLGFVVQRHLDIETFHPEPYWVLELNLYKGTKKILAQWDGGRTFQKSKIEHTFQSCTKDISSAQIIEVLDKITKEKKEARPIAFNTVAFLKACSKGLNLSPHYALSIAERLYLSGYVSYPRTESSAYPQSFDIGGTLRFLQQDGRFTSAVSQLLQSGHTKGRGGVDMGDHPPITPQQPGYGLSGDMARVFELICRHFIATVSDDAIWRSTRITLQIPSLKEKGYFSFGGKEIVYPGFLSVLSNKQYGDDDNEEINEEQELVLPDFQKNEVMPLHLSTSSSSFSSSGKVGVAYAGTHGILSIREKRTTPPTHLTESELISLMDKHGIGTDASIPTHIENIMKRNYAELMPGRKLKPSKLGLVLAQGYHAIDSTLVLPQVRGDIEDQCFKIAKGEANKDSVISKAIQFFSQKYNFFTTNISKMDLLFGASFTQLADVGKPFTRCGFTRRYLNYIVGPPARLYDKYTETVYPFPIGGMVKQWMSTGKKCTVCNFELCLYSVGTPIRTFPCCVYCFIKQTNDEKDDPKDVDVADEQKEKELKYIQGRGNLTLQCPLPNSHPIIRDMTVHYDISYGNNSAFILDPTSAGQKWKFISTSNPATIITFPKTVEKITILEKKIEEDDDDYKGCKYIKIDFKEPMDGKPTKYTCCFPKDEWIQKVCSTFVVKEKEDSDRNSSYRGGGRKSGRGKGGRGGRGGGRGGGRDRREY